MGYGSLEINGPNIKSQNIANNYSIISFGVYLNITNSQSYASNATGYATVYYRSGVNWDWVKVTTVSFPISFSGITTRAFVYAVDLTSYPIYHDSEGKMDVRVEASFDWGSSGGPIYGSSGWKNLPTISRASTLICSQSSVTPGQSGHNTISGTIVSQNVNYSHKLVLKFNNKTQDITINNNAFEYQLDTTWLAQIPSNTSGNASLTLTTYYTTSNTTSIIGNPAKINLIINCPEYSYDLSAPSTSYSVGRQINSSPLQNYSYINADIANLFNPLYGTTFVEKSIELNGIKTNAEYISGQLLQFTSNSLKFFVKDARGKSGTREVTINATAYYSPTFQIGVSLPNGATAATITLKGKIAPITNTNRFKITSILRSGNGSTDVPITIPSQFSSWCDPRDYGTFDNFTFSFIDSTIASHQSYNYTITLTDLVNTVIPSAPSATICMSRHAGGDGVTFGAEAASGGLVSKWDATFEGSVTVKDNSSTSRNLLDLIYPIGSIYISVNSTNPQTIFGGSWSRIQDCFLLSAGSTYSAGSTGGSATHTLTVSEMPSHNHAYYGFNVSDSVLTGNTDGSVLHKGHKYSYDQNNIKNTGGGQAHNNMPPYLAVYMWERTA